MNSELQTLCEKIGLTCQAELVGPATDDSGWEHDLWKVTLRLEGRQYTTKFRTGTGWRGKPAPNAADVVSCLAMSARLGESSFEDYCADLGYDSDSIKAKKVWQACKRTAPRMRRLLGAHFETVSASEH